ncbi:MAG TPA: HEAT repeat domain-containing protein [Actinomycetota bacterium]
MSQQAEKGNVLVHPAPGEHEEDVARAVHVLEDPKSDFQAKVAAADRLGRGDGGEASVSALLGAMHDPYAQVRGAAAFALGRLGDLKAVGPLVSLLQDASDEVRCRAAVALGLIGSVSVLRSTETELPEDRTIRWAAIQALGNLGRPAVDCLAKALRHGPRSERARVVVALGETRDVSAVGPLAEVLNDEDEEVQLRAREALEKIRESRVF